jgi:hypothetical protein
MDEPDEEDATEVIVPPSDVQEVPPSDVQDTPASDDATEE